METSCVVLGFDVKYVGQDVNVPVNSQTQSLFSYETRSDILQVPWFIILLCLMKGCGHGVGFQSRRKEIQLVDDIVATHFGDLRITQERKRRQRLHEQSSKLYACDSVFKGYDRVARKVYHTSVNDSTDERSDAER